MSEIIRVHVVDYGRKSLYMRYADPITGKQHTRSTGTKRRKEAERVAHKWEAELQEGRYKAPSKVTWFEFRDRYEREHLASLADRTGEKVSSTFNAVEEHLNPRMLAALTAERISTLSTKLRDKGLSDTTIKGHLAHLKAALNWAADMGLLTSVPKISMPKRAKGSKLMKGRPVTTEEFERMLGSVPKVVGKDAAESWKQLLRGLWWSGLRLGEALGLTWDGEGLRIDLDGKRPFLRIPAADEKGNRDRLLPLAPEAAEFLLATPEREQSGFVFYPVTQHTGGRPTLNTASRIITTIGEKAGVKVDEGERLGKPKTKFASAHDLRRAFGLRWSQRVMPAVLQQLMRHESIETTLRYYVGQDAEATAELLYATVGNSLGNTAQESPIDDRAQKRRKSQSQKTSGRGAARIRTGE